MPAIICAMCGASGRRYPGADACDCHSPAVMAGRPVPPTPITRYWWRHAKPQPARYARALRTRSVTVDVLAARLDAVLLDPFADERATGTAIAALHYDGAGHRRCWPRCTWRNPPTPVVREVMALRRARAHRCTACGHPLDDAATRDARGAQRFDTHPGCDDAALAGIEG